MENILYDIYRKMHIIRYGVVGGLRRGRGGGGL